MPRTKSRPPAHVSPPCNPLGETFDKLSGDVESNIYRLIDQAIGRNESISDGVNTGGIIYHMPGRPYDRRTASNKECATLFADMTLKGEFDRRRRLPHQISQWLREQAIRMYRAAELVETVIDRRNLKLIKTLVEESTVETLGYIWPFPNPVFALVQSSRRVASAVTLKTADETRAAVALFTDEAEAEYMRDSYFPDHKLMRMNSIDKLREFLTWRIEGEDKRWVVVDPDAKGKVRARWLPVEQI